MRSTVWHINSSVASVVIRWVGDVELAQHTATYFGVGRVIVCDG